ncbi:MAG: ATP-binding protein [Bacteroidetes bacterium]|nr:ATP-binding protein [Bacteroidota bacterium]
MELIRRIIEDQVIKSLVPNKVLILLGPRRVGKTVLIKQVIQKLNEPYLLLNGKDFSVLEILSRRSVQNYKNLLGDKRVLLIDEAQKIPDIGKILKLMVDEIEGIRILSAFDIGKYTGEPLTGRKKTFNLFSLSEQELDQIENQIEKRDNLRQRLIYGNYPELVQINNLEDKAEYLNEIVNSYLLKDILAFENIRNSDKILNLLRLVAFQIGGEISLSELASSLSMSKNTVEKYLDLLSKVFVLHKVGGFSRNLRKEVAKRNKWYFYDNGLRNILIANMNPLELRNDIGMLWENYIISERLKYQKYSKMIVNNYFWRTYDMQEIDWLEEREGKLFGYEFKWSPKKRPSAPKVWTEAYPESEFEVISHENYLDWVRNK